MENPRLAHPTSLRRSRIELASFVGASLLLLGSIALIGILAIDRIRGTETPEPRAFDVQMWSELELGTQKHAMGLWLAEEGSLIGLTEVDVRQMLGEPLAEGPVGGDTFVYQLRYWPAGDYRLVIRFESGVVSSATVRKYMF